MSAKKTELNEKGVRELIRNMIQEAVKEIGDVMDQPLNQMDNVHTSEHPNELIGAPEEPNKPSQKPMDTEKEADKHKNNPEVEQLNEGNDYTEEGDAIDVKMNSQESDGGYDAAAAVEVEASGSKHGGSSTKGQAKANFESKKGMNDDSNENGGDDKGEPHFDVDMNTMDGEGDDEGAKTRVEAGSEMSKGASKGQKDAKFHEDAKEEKDPYGRIADAIQLDELKDKQIGEKELQKFISEAARRVQKLL